MEVRILKCDRERFEREVEAFNEKAAKKGLEPIRFEVIRESVLCVSRTSRVVVLHLEVTGGILASAVGGRWRILGQKILLPVNEEGERKMLFLANNFWRETFVPEEIRRRDIVCEHCGLKRFRVQSFLLKDTKSGKIIEVGGSCVDDFTGAHVRSLAASCFRLNRFILPEDVDDIDAILAEREGRISYEHYFFPMETVLQYAAHAVREYSDGVYYSRNRAEEEGVEPTSFLVRKDIVYGLAIDEEAAKEGSEIYRWAKEYFADYTPADTANYEWNLKILLENDLVPYRAVGLAASLYVYYKRRQRERREREECRDAWLAPEGEKVEGEAVVITVCRVATFYGPSTLVKFITSDRHLCTTFSNAAWTLDVKEGHRIRFKGRVKRHTMYNGVKETQLTRVRVETLTE